MTLCDHCDYIKDASMYFEASDLGLGAPYFLDNIFLNKIILGEPVPQYRIIYFLQNCSILRNARVACETAMCDSPGKCDNKADTQMDRQTDTDLNNFILKENMTLTNSVFPFIYTWSCHL